MKNLFNKKMIFDYVSGNEVVGYDIETLENNYIFMMEVIKYTKDKNMYNLCGDKVKSNYKFVRFMIETFKDDKMFIIDIANEYLESTSFDDITSKELSILMTDFLPIDSENDKVFLNNLTYHAKRKCFYENEMCLINMALEEENSKNDMGFVYLIDEYSTSNIILNFFAKEYIKKIFYNNKNLEQLIHMQFKDCKIIEKQGVNNFILNYIRNYDCYLADYLAGHINLFDFLAEDIIKICNNWNKYLDDLYSENIDMFFYEVTKYLDDYLDKVRFDVKGLVVYILRQLHLENIYSKYYGELEICTEDVDILGENFNQVNLFNNSKLNLIEYKCLKDMFSLAQKIFTSTSVYYNDDYIMKSKNLKNHKVLNFPSKPNSFLKIKR